MKHRHRHTLILKPLLGFTLVELLVVISIIALLLAILMPSLKKARIQTQRLTCSTQLKQMGLAYNCYASDNNEKLPQFDYLSWYAGTRSMRYWKWGEDVLRAFLDKEGVYPTYMPEPIIFYCPTDKVYRRDYKWYIISTNTPRWSYMAWLGQRATELRGTHELQFDRPLTWHDGINILYGDFHVSPKRD